MPGAVMRGTLSAPAPTPGPLDMNDTLLLDSAASVGSGPRRGAWAVFLVACALVYIPNQRLFPAPELRGLNVTNVLILALWLAVLVAPGRTGPTPLRGRFILLFAVYGWGLVAGRLDASGAWTEDLQTLKNALTGPILFFLAFHAVGDRRARMRLFVLLLAVTLFDVMLGLRQALDYGLTRYDEARRVAAPFSWSTSDANRAAAYFCIYVPLFSAFLLYRRGSAVARAAAFGALALGVFVSFYTYSRQAYAILAALLLLLALRRSRVLGVLAVVALLNYSTWLPPSVLARIDMTISADARGPGAVTAPLSEEVDDSTASRLDIWRGAAGMIADAPWGVGLGHFRAHIGQYAPRYAGYDAHDDYVLITAENGVLAPLVLVMLLLGLFRLGRALERQAVDAQMRLFGVGLWLSTLAVALVNIYGSRFEDANLMAGYWILAGMAAREHADRRGSERANIPCASGRAGQIGCESALRNAGTQQG